MSKWEKDLDKAAVKSADSQELEDDTYTETWLAAFLAGAEWAKKWLADK